MGTEQYEIYKKLGLLPLAAGEEGTGLVKHIGFSFHDHADLLDKVLTEHPEVEFVQLQLNYLDWDSEGVQSASAMR